MSHLTEIIGRKMEVTAQTRGLKEEFYSASNCSSFDIDCYQFLYHIDLSKHFRVTFVAALYLWGQ